MATAHYTCSVPECEKPVDARGWCNKHYKRWKFHGDPLHEKVIRSGCDTSGCERKHYADGLCNMHYQRLKKTGTTDARVKQPKYCKVEDCGMELKIPYGRGMCARHYSKWRIHGDPLYTAPLLNIGECLVEGCEMAREVKGWCSKHYTRWSRYGDPEQTLQESFVCSICGIDYMAGPRQWKCCSAECATVATEQRRDRRLRQIAATSIEPFTRSEIFERDNWVCHICGDPIQRSAKWPSPGSASLDHVIPIARGGEHTRANTAASHLRCNVSKGARVAP